MPNPAPRPRAPSRPTLQQSLDAAESAAILAAFADCGRSIPAAAEALAVPRRTLYRRIEALGLRVATGIDAPTEAE